jgi:hypothetical protein
LESKLALHFSQQKATVLPSLPVLVMLESAGLPLMGHLSAAEATEAKERAQMVSSVFIEVCGYGCGQLNDRPMLETYETGRFLSIFELSLSNPPGNQLRPPTIYNHVFPIP